MEQLDQRYPEMKSLCEQFNARAYIRLSRRDAREIAKDLLILLGDAFRNNSFQHLRKIYSTAVGRNKGLDKIWIIDVDDDAMNVKLDNGFISWLSVLKPQGDKVLSVIPTKQGIHIITKPFDLKEFKV